MPFSPMLLAAGQWRRRETEPPLRRAVVRSSSRVAVGLISAWEVALARGDGAGWLGVVVTAHCAAAPASHAGTLAAAAVHAGRWGALG